MKSTGAHSPGPWAVFGEEYPDVEFCGIDAADGSTVIIYGDGRDQDECGVRGKTRAERLANARLIAAAPELLAVCRRLVFMVDNLEIGKNFHGNEVITEARRIIADATGEDV